MLRHIRYLMALTIVVQLPAYADTSSSLDSQWLLSKYDLNGDASITQDEVSNKRQSIFTYMDADGDSKISFQEYVTLDNLKRQTILKARFNKLDTNHDGEVSQEEYRSYSGLFNSIDSDGNGKLTPSEISQSKVKAKQSSTHCLLWFCMRTSL